MSADALDAIRQALRGSRVQAGQAAGKTGGALIEAATNAATVWAAENMTGHERAATLQAISALRNLSPRLGEITGQQLSELLEAASEGDDNRLADAIKAQLGVAALLEAGERDAIEFVEAAKRGHELHNTLSELAKVVGGFALSLVLAAL